MSSPSTKTNSNNNNNNNSVQTGRKLPVWLQARVDQYFGIGQRYQSAASFYLRHLWISLRQGHFNVLFGQANYELHERAFADFYETYEQGFATYEATTALPRLVASAHGTVVDLGPGTGIQLGYFDQAAARVAHVYGVEPNGAFRERFLAKLRATGLGREGKYTLINTPHGIEDEHVLRRFGVDVEGGVDCVVSMQVMCSIPNLEAQIRHIHNLLKPGGELIFWEHCCNSKRETRIVQWLWSTLWHRVFGGCRLDRVTKEIILGAADWEIAELEYDEQGQAYSMMPRLYGRLVKPQGGDRL